MERRSLSFKSSQISYLRFGSGPGTLLCFHGYGEDASSFSFLEKYAGHDYTFFAVDLPFHGETIWREGNEFTVGDLSTITASILGIHDRQPGPENPYSIMGYSLGGRMALGLYEMNSSMTRRLILLAPDGLKVNFWYWLSTQTWLGNRIFRYTMYHPAWFFAMLKIFNRLGFVNASIFKFVNYYIGDAGVRQQLYARWTALRKVRPGIGVIKKNIPAFRTRVHLIYGRHDRIILPSVGEKFRKGIESFSHISIINSGHQVLQEKHVGEILPALLR